LPSDQLVDEIDSAQFAEQRAIESNLVDAVQDVPRSARRLVAFDRIDLHDDDVFGAGFIEERPERRIAGIAAIPIGRAGDLDSLEQTRQAGRSHDVIGGQLATVKNRGLPREDVRGRNQQFNAFARAKFFKIDDLGEMVAQRVEVERIELIGAGKICQRFEPEIGGRRAEGERSEIGVEKLALDGRQGAFLADREPEVMELATGALAPVIDEPLGERHRVHRPRARAADRLDIEPVILEKEVEHAPRIGAVRPSPLQSKIDRLHLNGSLARAQALTRRSSRRRSRDSRR